MSMAGLRERIVNFIYKTATGSKEDPPASYTRRRRDLFLLRPGDAVRRFLYRRAFRPSKIPGGDLCRRRFLPFFGCRRLDLGMVRLALLQDGRDTGPDQSAARPHHGRPLRLFAEPDDDRPLSSHGRHRHFLRIDIAHVCDDTPLCARLHSGNQAHRGTGT